MTETVKTKELIKSLVDERVIFAPWDEWRCSQVDIILEAIKRNEKDAKLEDIHKTVTDICPKRNKLYELKKIAVKLLKIHFHLQILELAATSDVTIEDIKSQYRKLAKIYHPDLENGDERYFKLITKAYEYLLNVYPK